MACNMENIELVVLMAGKAKRLQPLSYSLPKGLHSYMQIPSLYTMLIPYIRNGLKDITLIVSPGDKDIVTDFINKAFSEINIKVKVQDIPKGPLHAFQQIGKVTKETLLLLGDTSCETDVDFSESFIAYTKVPDYERWCLLNSDAQGYITGFIDKPSIKPDTDKAVIGLYFFKNIKLLNKLLKKKFGKIHNEYQLSSLLEEYIKVEKTKAYEFSQWKDSGTLQNFIELKRSSLTGRMFNSFKVSDNGIITKKSNFDVLKREAYWYENISSTSLAVYIPQFFGYKLQGSMMKYQIEYLPYKTLAEYFVFYPIIDNNWKFIFSDLLSVLEDFWNFKKFKCNIKIKDSCRKMYIDKTLARIKEWDRQDLLELDNLIINGKKYLGLNKILDKILEKVEKIIDNSEEYLSVIHGDPSFQNILYHPDISHFKLIDPRGAFPGETMFGDKRYELAKLRHNYHGLYDYVVYEMYKLNECEGKFDYSYFTTQFVDYHIFDNIIEEKGFDISEIQLIEGLLFISMIPFHKDKPQNQVMFYLIGLQILNDVIMVK